MVKDTEVQVGSKPVHILSPTKALSLSNALLLVGFELFED